MFHPGQRVEGQHFFISLISLHRECLFLPSLLSLLCSHTHFESMVHIAGVEWVPRALQIQGQGMSWIFTAWWLERFDFPFFLDRQPLFSLLCGQPFTRKGRPQCPHPVQITGATFQPPIFPWRCTDHACSLWRGQGAEECCSCEDSLG